MEKSPIKGKLERRSQLRPILIAEYNPVWPSMYESERLRIFPIVPASSIIEHVGSTAVPNLCAKPIIDIMVIVKDMGQADSLIPQLNGLGYDKPMQRNSPEQRRFLLRYLEASAIEGFHLHILSQNNTVWIKEFIERRDFLRTHPDTTFAYGELKKMLAQQYGSKKDRRMYKYAEAKRQFLNSSIPLYED